MVRFGEWVVLPLHTCDDTCKDHHFIEGIENVTRWHSKKKNMCAYVQRCVYVSVKCDIDESSQLYEYLELIKSNVESI